MHQRATLANGVRILTSRMAHVRSVSIIFFFGVGSRFESAQTSGVSHFIEHMLFKGSANFPTAQIISESVEGVGGILDAETGKEMTVYSAKIASHHFDLAMNLLTDMVRRPRFDPAEIEKERRVIIEELNMYRDSPQDWVSVLGEEAFWPGLSLGREVAGTRETVESLSRETMCAYMASHYAPSNLVVAVVGDAAHDDVVASVDRLLGDWTAGEASRWEPCEPPRQATRVRLETRRTAQTNLCLYTLGLSRTDPDYYALALLNAIFGDGMSSRLFLNVREHKGLAYDVSSSPAHYHDTGAFIVYAGVEPRQTLAALQAILVEMARMRDEPVNDGELARAKEYTKGRLALGLEDTHSVAWWLGGNEAMLGEVRELDDVLARIDAVSREDIQRVAQRLFVDEWLRLAIIGPNRGVVRIERALAL